MIVQNSVVWKGFLNLGTDIILWSAILVGRHQNLYQGYNITIDTPPISTLRARYIAADYYDLNKAGPCPVYVMLSKSLRMGATTA